MGKYEEIEATDIYEYIRDYLPVIPILSLKKGEYLWRVDSESDTLFYILQGTIKVENVSYSGKKLVVDTIPEQDFGGAISAIHKADFQCSGVAESTVKVLVLKKTLMDELMLDDGFAAFFYRKTSKRVYIMYKTILARSLFGQDEIMAYYILENAKGEVFQYKSIYSICEHLGISRRGIYNILYRFEKTGGIKKEDNSAYRILDRGFLEAIAEQVIIFMDNGL